jgi:eukaryotic-like serine/threonine-protein kinase
VSDFENLLDELIPGAGRGGVLDAEVPMFPKSLGLEPLGLLARGGSGWVFRAHDPVLQRDVAIKIGRADTGEAGRRQLIAEAQRTAQLDHPAVLPVNRLIVADGQVCIEYRLAPSATLATWLADPNQAPPRPTDRLQALAAVASALRRAHAMGLVHGDLHPGNIAVSDGGSVYVLDWAGPLDNAEPGRLSGAPTHAAPEVLEGQPATAASDVYALGVLAWELCALRPMRPRLPGEELGVFLSRWQVKDAPTLPAWARGPTGLAALLGAALARDPAARPDMDRFAQLLADMLSGSVERGQRHARGRALLEKARDILARYRELGNRLSDEQRVVMVQRGKVPGHAPTAAKQALWAAEDRVAGLEQQRVVCWLEAVSEATLAGALAPVGDEADEMLAELWWERMEDMERRDQTREVSLARAQIVARDPSRRGRALLAPCLLSLDVTPADATVTLTPLAPDRRVLRPTSPTEHGGSIHRMELPEGSYLCTVCADGFEPLRYPVELTRGGHHHGTAQLWPDGTTPPGWVRMVGGSFRLGGDDQARAPLDRCRPTLDDLLVQVTPVTCAQYAAFLDALPPAEARSHAPGWRSSVGGAAIVWTEGPSGWSAPEDWHPEWPVIGVSQHDAEALARWMSDTRGMAVRLPSEEEWEKAARGVDGRSWPWGDSFDPNFAHMRGSLSGRPEPAIVGRHPIDTSVWGCVDIAGNVQEWTSTLTGDGLAVVRGGSWLDEPDELRCAARRTIPTVTRAPTLGIRLVAAPAQRLSDSPKR